MHLQETCRLIAVLLTMDGVVGSVDVTCAVLEGSVRCLTYGIVPVAFRQEFFSAGFNKFS
jgi:hypothetical protein